MAAACCTWNVEAGRAELSPRLGALSAQSVNGQDFMDSPCACPPTAADLTRALCSTLQEAAEFTIH